MSAAGPTQVPAEMARMLEILDRGNGETAKAAPASASAVDVVELSTSQQSEIFQLARRGDVEALHAFVTMLWLEVARAKGLSENVLVGSSGEMTEEKVGKGAHCEALSPPLSVAESATSCLTDEARGVQNLMKAFKSAVTTAKGFIHAKGRYVGIKCVLDGGYIMSASHEDKIVASAIQYAAMNSQPLMVAYLMLLGADPEDKIGLPPHIPQEPSAIQLAEGNGCEFVAKVVRFMSLWRILPKTHEKKRLMLERPPVSDFPPLMEFLSTVVHERYLVSDEVPSTTADLLWSGVAPQAEQ